MIDGIKERFQIAHRSAAEMTGAASPKGERSESIDCPLPSLLFRFPLHCFNRVVGTSCRTKSIAVFAENRFIDRCQDLSDRLLNDSIQHCRDAQRPFRAIRFREPTGGRQTAERLPAG